MEKAREYEQKNNWEIIYFQIIKIWFWWHNDFSQDEIHSINWLKNYYFKTEKEASDYIKENNLDPNIYIIEKTELKPIQKIEKTQTIVKKFTEYIID
jgi:hypothetical protein